MRLFLLVIFSFVLLSTSLQAHDFAETSSITPGAHLVINGFDSSLSQEITGVSDNYLQSLFSRDSLTFSKTDPDTGFTVIVKIKQTDSAIFTPQRRVKLLNKTIQCAKFVSSYYQFPLPQNISLHFYFQSGPGVKFYIKGGRRVFYGFNNYTWLSRLFSDLDDDSLNPCWEKHEMMHALTPHWKGILEEGFATYTQDDVMGIFGGPIRTSEQLAFKCTEQGYLINSTGRLYHVPYTLTHVLEIEPGVRYKRDVYESGLCFWIYVHSVYGLDVMRQIFNKVERSGCNYYGDCITKYILPVLGEQRTRIIERKFDLHRTDTERNVTMPFRPIAVLNSPADVMSAPWWRNRGSPRINVGGGPGGEIIESTQVPLTGRLVEFTSNFIQGIGRFLNSFLSR